MCTVWCGSSYTECHFLNGSLRGMESLDNVCPFRECLLTAVVKPMAFSRRSLMEFQVATLEKTVFEKNDIDAVTLPEMAEANIQNRATVNQFTTAMHHHVRYVYKSCPTKPQRFAQSKHGTS